MCIVDHMNTLCNLQRERNANLVDHPSEFTMARLLRCVENERREIPRSVRCHILLVDFEHECNLSCFHQSTSPAVRSATEQTEYLSTMFESSSDLGCGEIPGITLDQFLPFLSNTLFYLLHFGCRTPKQFDVPCTHDVFVLEQCLCCFMFRSEHDESIACTASIGIMNE